MWGCLCVFVCKVIVLLIPSVLGIQVASESQVFCTPSFIELSLLVFWCTYIAKHFKRSLPSWLSNLVESMFLCIHKKNINDANFPLSFLMIIKKIVGQLFKPFFFKYCWTNWTLKWGKKTVYWLHFFNLPPLRELQQIFVLYETKVMIYWQKSGKIQKVDPISLILKANKKYWK